MKSNKFFLVILLITFLYLLKKGKESADSKGEKLSFIEILKRGFDVTVKPVSGNDNLIDKVGKEDSFSSFSELEHHLNRERKAAFLRKKSAAWDAFEEAERAQRTRDEMELRGFSYNN